MPNITTNHAITYTNRHYFVENYDSQLKPNLSSKRFRLGNLFEDLDKTHDKLFPYFTHHYLIALWCVFDRREQQLEKKG